ncbi:histidinol-phosphate transaminase [Syntrophomonas wolfei]|uniref:Histidinol-phosphate aminotransferase n=1 Tax=Syntrophomonas wolfei subsp. wolfei (strain DSM 2245B / Goettingen) TaxID=335541 RepID=Q0AVZ5_SYNWW|nr:histidinol-phosphate transaminase [Syntrophomonas wolfei]ABI69109.1 histidinol phosphate aminotransferase [Syntrophomonas wolfei subsp. wolfei str. Goettingen G311]
MNLPKLDRLVPSYIKGFEAYIPSKPDPELKKLFGCKQLYRLNNNENPLGPPPAAQEMLHRFETHRAAIYPSGDSYYLRDKLAEKYKLHPDQILVGNGANEVITFAIKAFCEAGDNIITADKTFAVYEWVAIFSGYEARLVPLKDFCFDDEGMLAQIDERTKILFICNPNNPTGTYWNQEKLCRFLDRIDGKQIVVVDEAYCEFVEKEDFPDGIALIERYPNLVVFRTFSKMYGLAGLRIGYLAGSLEVVNIMRRACVVYSVNTLAQETALLALDDPEHIQKTNTLVKKEKAYLYRELTRLGLPLVMHEGNFVMIKLPISDTLAYRKLMARGVMVRSMTGFRYPNYIRITIAQHEAMEALIESLRAIFKASEETAK